MNKVQVHSLFTEFDIDLFKAGKHFRLYEKLGAHPIELDGVKGVYFAVWAPSAQSVSVVGDFNYWIAGNHELYVRWDASGIWEGFIPNITKGTTYKYKIQSSNNGIVTEKADPFAFYCEKPPHTASVIWDLDYQWDDDKWMKSRKEHNALDKPYSVYEVHLGSWKQKFVNRNEGGAPMEAFNSYKDITPLLIEHLKENNYTHVELLPITEHPLDASWGYQVTGYYSPTSRFGKPDELKYLIDQLHHAGIGVILDWVPLHFCKDAHGLYQFDGSWLYEYPYEHDRENHQWGTANFDLGKGMTRSFLLSNLKYWLEYFHFDGIRVDALSYILYWRGETTEDKINHAAIDFIKRVNAMVHTDYKGVLMIAEDSSSFPKVTHSLEDGGIGFDMKWDLGWMNDTLKYMGRPSVYRKYHSNEITFGMYYNQNEHFLLPLSHDEVVHGKHSIIGKMDGNYEDQFNLARAYYSFYFAHPGKKLLFMGNEWGHIREWHEYTEMDWNLLQFPIHQSFYQMMKTLSTFYKENDAFWKYDYQAYEKGFNWVKIDGDSNLFAFSRMSDDQEILTIHNFNDQELFDVHLDLPAESEYKLVFSSSTIPMESFSIYPNENGVTITMPRLTSFYFEKMK